MRKTFLIICMIVFANYANNILAGNGDKAWISECSQGDRPPVRLKREKNGTGICHGNHRDGSLTHFYKEYLVVTRIREHAFYIGNF